MKRLLGSILLALCFSSHASEIIRATITVTNAVGTEDGETITVNGTVRTWTAAVSSPATQIATNGLPTWSATNMFNQFAVYPFSGVSLRWTAADAIELQSLPGGPLAVSLSAGWGTVVLSTNQLTNSVFLPLPITVLAPAAQTNLASLLADALGKSTNAIRGAFIGDVTGGLQGHATNLVNHGLAFSSVGAADGSEQFGATAAANGYLSTAAGSSSAADVDKGSAFGYSAHAGGTNATAIGAEASAGGLSSVAVGQLAAADGANSVAVGQNSQAGSNSLALGTSAAAPAAEAMAIGRAATASATRSLAMGEADATAADAIAVGYLSAASGEMTIAMGNSSSAEAFGATAFGQFATATGTNSTALGKNSVAEESDATAVGGAVASARGSVALGSPTQATGTNSTAIGAGAMALHDFSTALGAGSRTTATNQVMVGRTNQTVVVPGELVSAWTRYPRLSNTGLANGANAAVSPGTNTFLEVSGPSGAFSINGIAGGSDGRLLILVNQTGQNMTLAHDSGVDPTPANRIYSMTGGDRATTGNGAAVLIYSGAASRWILISFDP